MSYVLSPKGFLQVGGVVLVLVAVLGYVGLIGPTSDSLFGEYWYFDNAENIAHLVLGVVALIASVTISSSLQRYLTIAVGALAFVVALVSLVGQIPMGTTLLGAALQNPFDTVLHIVVGVWAVLAYRGGSSVSAGGMM